MRVLTEHRGRVEALRSALDRLMGLHEALHDARHRMMQPMPVCGDDPQAPENPAQAEVIQLCEEIRTLHIATFGSMKPESERMLQGVVESAVAIAPPVNGPLPSEDPGPQPDRSKTGDG